MGISVTWKPVPKMIASASVSVPSEATSVLPRTSFSPDDTRSTLGRASAGYQLLDSRMRLQPMR